jgi:FlgD Ig-like domain
MHRSRLSVLGVLIALAPSALQVVREAPMRFASRLLRSYRRFLVGVAASLTFALVLSTLEARPAQAVLPSPGFSTLPAGINLVGRDAGVADPHGRFFVRVKGTDDLPMSGVTVKLDFSGAPDLSIAQVQDETGTNFVSCVPPIISGTTDNDGYARFNVVGSIATHAANGIPSGGCVATVTAGSTLLGSVPVAAFDIDGLAGVTPNDVHMWYPDFFLGTNPCYVDFDHQGGVGANDLSVLVSDLFDRGSRLSGFSQCIPVAGLGVMNVNATLSLATMDCGPGSGYSALWNTSGKYTDLLASVKLGGNLSWKSVTGVEATFLVKETGGNALPAFWQFQGGTGCLPTRLQVRGTPGDGNFCLEDPPSLAWMRAGDGSLLTSTGGAFAIYPHPVSQLASEEEIRVVMTLLSDPYVGPGVPVAPSFTPCTYDFGSIPNNVKVPLFYLRIQHGTLSCAGASASVSITLQSLKLTKIVPSDRAYTLSPDLCPSQSATFPTLAGQDDPQADVLEVEPSEDSDNVVLANATTDVPRPGIQPVLWLSQGKPNPASGRLSLRFAVPREGRVRAMILDVSGRNVRTLMDADVVAGEHPLVWDGRDATGADVSDGVYFCRLTTPDGTRGRTLVLRR